MGDYGINQTIEYSELNLDSWDSTYAGGTFENSTSNSSLVQYSWPQFNFTQKKLDVVGIKVLEAQIPFVWDTVNGDNNKFTYISNAVSYTITIPVGTYSGTSLATQLQTLLAAITPGFLVTYSTTTLKFTFTYPLAFTWSITCNTRKSAYSILGFLPSVTYTNVGVGSTIVTPMVAQVTGPYYLYINSRRIGSLVNMNLPDGAITGGVGPEICRIPIDVQYGSILFYKDPDPAKYFDFFAHHQFDSFDLYLTLGSDQYQKPLDLKGSPWSVKLGLLCYRKATTNLYDKPTSGITRIG